MATIGNDDVQQAIMDTGAKWMAGPTSMLELTDAQRRSRLGVIDREEAQARGAQQHASAAEAPPGSSWPQRFDWRDQNKVTASGSGQLRLMRFIRVHRRSRVQDPHR